MRHGMKQKKLNMTTAQRRALFSNLTNALLTHEQINITVTRAKVLRTYADNMITYALTKRARNKTILDLYKTKFRNHKFFKALRKLPQMGLIADDYSSFYSENYGISKKGLVLLDGGLTAETAQLYY